MEDSNFSKQKHADARTFTFRYFCPQFRKQGFNVCPFIPPSVGRSKILRSMDSCLRFITL